MVTTKSLTGVGAFIKTLTGGEDDTMANNADKHGLAAESETEDRNLGNIPSGCHAQGGCLTPFAAGNKAVKLS